MRSVVTFVDCFGGRATNIVGVGVDTAVLVQGCHFTEVDRAVSVSAEEFSLLLAKFPILEGADDLVTEAIVRLQREDRADAQENIQNSPLGFWLRQQSFVDWAALTAAILALAT